MTEDFIKTRLNYRIIYQKNFELVCQSNSSMHVGLLLVCIPMEGERCSRMCIYQDSLGVYWVLYPMIVGEWFWVLLLMQLLFILGVK